MAKRKPVIRTVKRGGTPHLTQVGSSGAGTRRRRHRSMLPATIDKAQLAADLYRAATAAQQAGSSAGGGDGTFDFANPAVPRLGGSEFQPPLIGAPTGPDLPLDYSRGLRPNDLPPATPLQGTGPVPGEPGGRYYDEMTNANPRLAGLAAPTGDDDRQADDRRRRRAARRFPRAVRT